MKMNDNKWALFAILMEKGGYELFVIQEEFKFDVATEFVRARLSGMKFGRCDLSGWCLHGTNLTNSDLSEVVNIQGASFDDETNFTNTILPVGVTAEYLLALKK